MRLRLIECVAGMAVLLVGLAGIRTAGAQVLILEHDAPAAIVGMTAAFLENAGASGIEDVTVATTDAEGAEIAVGAGEFLMTVIPIERFSDLVRASDLYSVPFLMADAQDRAAIMRRDSRVRTSFDTVTVNFGVRILAMLPVGYEGIALDEVGDITPDVFDSVRVLADGPAERGMVGAVDGFPVERGRHVAAILAPWEFPSSDGDNDYENPYRVYFDLRHAPTVFVLVVNHRDWVAMSDAEKAVWESAATSVEDEALSLLDLRHDHELDRLRASGVEVVSPDEELRMEWSAMTAGLSRAIYLGEGAQLARAFLRAVDQTLASN